MRLADLQAAFAASVRAPSASPVPSLLLAEMLETGVPAADRLGIYRRTSQHTQRAALRQAYPVVETLIGENLFVALANEYIAAPGSCSGDLHLFGAGFERTFADEPACAALHYLPDVARLEWAVHRSFFAANSPAIVCVDPVSVSASEQPRLCLVAHPSLHVLAGAGPAAAIWEAHQMDDGEALGRVDLSSGPEWLAVYRRGELVCIDRLSSAGYAVLAASLAGDSLLRALEQVGDAPLDLTALLPRWLQAGLLSGLGLVPCGR